MSDYSHSSELVLSELLRISTGFIWKNPKRALDNENQAYSIDVEQYKLSVQNKLTFDIVYKFYPEAIMELGYTEEQANLYSDMPARIPIEKRDLFVKQQMSYIIRNYEEHNNYYRMLNGLPDLEDTDCFYNTKYPDISDENTPLHKLDISQLYALEAKGYIQDLINGNPKKEYLNHLTDKKIDIYTARSSEDYAILWIKPSTYTTLYNDFKETYNQCRYMVLNVYYMKSLETKNTEYVGFIGMVILFSTIIQIHRKFLDADITRDFYDEDSLRYVYDSYGVPFYPQIPIDNHKEIVKNMNILISHKGSSKVFYDLFDIFGFERMEIFKFYMMKIHKFQDGKPVFIKKSDGSYDLRAMYDVVFSKVSLDSDPSSQLIDQRNHVGYNNLTSGDPYWINDEDLMNKLYSEEYNYMESKYLGIQTTFNLMKIIYETSYYFKLIIDNRRTLEGTAVYNNSIHANSNLFELVVYICALITRKFGFAGNIPADPHEIGKVMGFNFKDDIMVLKQNISENDYLKNDAQLLNYLSKMNVNSLESVEYVYSNLTSLRTYLINKMSGTDNVEEYWAYYELYNTIMYSEYVHDVFVKSNGEPAESFEDLLQDTSKELYSRYIATTEYDPDDEISDALYLLKSSCSKLKYIQYADNINVDQIIEYLFKLLDFFKSAKADLTGYEIIYSLVSKSENIIKLMNIIDRINDDYTSDPIYSIFDDIVDLIKMIREWMYVESKYRLDDEIVKEYDSKMIQSIIDRLEDYIALASDTIYTLASSTELHDYLSYRERVEFPGDPFAFGDDVKLLYDEVKEVIRYFVRDEFEIETVIAKVTDTVDSLRHLENKMEFRDSLIHIYLMTIYSSIEFDTVLKNIVDKSKVVTLPYKISDVITHIYYKLNLNTNVPISTDIDYGSDNFKKEIIGSFEMKDSTSMEFIQLLYLDIEKNHIQYLSELIKIISKWYVQSDMNLEETLLSTDFLTKIGYSEQLLSDDLLYKEKVRKRESEATMSDTLILLSEKKYEE